MAYPPPVQFVLQEINKGARIFDNEFRTHGYTDTNVTYFDDYTMWEYTTRNNDRQDYNKRRTWVSRWQRTTPHLKGH